jgi:RNA polymerase sigma-70 factor (ECF subfamily)
MSSPTDPAPETAPIGHWAAALSPESAAARQAMNEIAASYWYPVYAWWRRAGLPAEKAAIATEASFTRWRDMEPPAAADEGAARLREWLLVRLRVLASAGVKPLPNPAVTVSRSWSEQRFAKEPERDPDAVFQRRWALTVLEFTVSMLHAEYKNAGKTELCALLMPFLGFAGGEERYEEIAPKAGMSSGALHVAVFDFRKRYRDLLRAVIADTVAHESEVDSEMTALLCATN